MSILKTQHKLFLETLSEEYKSYGKILIALSGGVDSCLAAFLGRKILGRDNAVAVISNSASLKEKDYAIAVKFCNDHDIGYEVIYTKELEDSSYTSNPINRCYFCKNELYLTMKKLVDERYANYKIINGNNFSDLGDYRPGLTSASEQEIYSPFISCKINKAVIRELAQYFNLEVWDKPASPCLSSRFPYGEEITIDKLKRVEHAEQILNDFGFDEVRVRSYGDIAKIEVPKNKLNLLKGMFQKVEIEIKKVGFSYCEIDNEGFVSGKMNRILNEL